MAFIKAVRPLLSLILTFAPIRISIETFLGLQFHVATEFIKTVLPSLSLALISAPASISMSTLLWSFPLTATIKAVIPLLSLVLTSAPALSNTSTISECQGQILIKAV